MGTKGKKKSWGGLGHRFVGAQGSEEFETDVDCDKATGIPGALSPKGNHLRVYSWSFLVGQMVGAAGAIGKNCSKEGAW